MKFKYLQMEKHYSDREIVEINLIREEAEDLGVCLESHIAYGESLAVLKDFLQEYQY